MPKVVKVNELIVPGVAINAADGRGIHGISVRLKSPNHRLVKRRRTPIARLSCVSISQMTAKRARRAIFP